MIYSFFMERKKQYCLLNTHIGVMCLCTKQYDPQMPTLHSCRSGRDHTTRLVFLWIFRGELRTELHFLLQRAHFWHHFLFYLFVSLTFGNEVSSVWAVSFSQHCSLLSVFALYPLLVLAKANSNKKQFEQFLLVSISAFCQFLLCIPSLF